MATATYVPAPVEQLPEALAAFEEFLQERGRLPDLIQCAMLHAQFESIHPFVGGNGRLGRLLITLFLIERQRLTRPLLYLSAFLEGHRDEYYALLQRVRTHNEWTPWLTFFAVGVHETAERATRQARALIRHYERDREKVKGHALRLADELFRTPAMTVPEAKRILEVTDPTARRAVRELEARGLLAEWSEKRWPRVYLARHVLDAVLHPLEDLRSGPGTAGPGTVVKSEATQAQRSRRAAPTASWPRPWTPSTRRAPRACSCASPAASPSAATASTSTSWTASTRTSTSSAARTRRRRSTTSSRRSTTRRTATSPSPPTPGSCSTSRTRRSRA